MRVWCISTPAWQRSWYVSILANVCAFRWFGALIHSTSVSARWWSTTQQFSTEQIQQDRQSDTDTTLKHPVSFRIKHSVLTPVHISLNFINKSSWCAESDLKSTDQRFSEAAVTLDSIITAKFRSLGSQAVWPCCWWSTEQTCSRTVPESNQRNPWVSRFWKRSSLRRHLPDSRMCRHSKCVFLESYTSAAVW